MYFVSFDRIFKVECHAVQAFDNGVANSESERLFARKNNSSWLGIITIDNRNLAVRRNDKLDD